MKYKIEIYNTKTNRWSDELVGDNNEFDSESMAIQCMNELAEMWCLPAFDEHDVELTRDDFRIVEIETE